MNWDFAWLADPSAWVGLGVLILLELALGIDNLLFISLLAGRLPRNRRKEAFRVGMGLALLQRFVLLAAMAWLIELRCSPRWAAALPCATLFWWWEGCFCFSRDRRNCTTSLKVVKNGRKAREVRPGSGL